VPSASLISSCCAGIRFGTDEEACKKHKPNQKFLTLEMKLKISPTHHNSGHDDNIWRGNEIQNLGMPQSIKHSDVQNAPLRIVAFIKNTFTNQQQIETVFC
jgi:hypothetical protein